VLSDEQKVVCQQAVQVFGRRWQVLKVVEELRELATELEAAAHGLGTTLERIVDERADVEIMLYQLDTLILPGMASQVPHRIPAKIEKLKGYMEVGR
jgi:hypothetical protein